MLSSSLRRETQNFLYPVAFTSLSRATCSKAVGAIKFQLRLALAPVSPPQARPHQNLPPQPSTSPHHWAAHPPIGRKSFSFRRTEPGFAFGNPPREAGGLRKPGAGRGGPGKACHRDEGSRFCRSPPLPLAPEKSLPVWKNFLPPRPPLHSTVTTFPTQWYVRHTHSCWMETCVMLTSCLDLRKRLTGGGEHAV